MATNKLNRRQRIKKSIRRKIKGTAEKPRLSVYRSNTSIYVQLVDDVKGRTLLASSSMEVAGKRALNKEVSAMVGKKIAEKALEQGISSVVFDRNGFLYHGNVKALADGAREGGMNF